MPIALNYYLNVKTNEDGEQKLFGKVGYQTMNPKTDKYTLANLAAIERAMKAGNLTDLDGNPVTNNATIDVYARVSIVADADEIEEVSSFRNSAGGTAEAVPAPSADAQPDDDNPF